MALVTGFLLLTIGLAGCLSRSGGRGSAPSGPQTGSGRVTVTVRPYEAGNLRLDKWHVGITGTSDMGEVVFRALDIPWSTDQVQVVGDFLPVPPGTYELFVSAINVASNIILEQVEERVSITPGSHIVVHVRPRWVWTSQLVSGTEQAGIRILEDGTYAYTDDPTVADLFLWYFDGPPWSLKLGSLRSDTIARAGSSRVGYCVADPRSYSFDELASKFEFDPYRPLAREVELDIDSSNLYQVRTSNGGYMRVCVSGPIGRDIRIMWNYIGPREVSFPW